jgi:hypothetical protein
MRNYLIAFVVILAYAIIAALLQWPSWLAIVLGAGLGFVL